MSWQVELKVTFRDTTVWVGNEVRFASKEQAEAYAVALAQRYTEVRRWRVSEVNDPVTGSVWSMDVTG